jgi:tagatose 6-phosphate kinase
MILCVCLSPALDITYQVDRLAVGGTNRVTHVGARAGGKAVNVARVLHELGEPVCVLAPVGGRIGDHFTAHLRDLDVAAALVPTSLPTRRTVTIAESAGTATVLTEPATIDCWDAVLEHVAARLADADVLVLSGSVPAGVPATALSTMTAMARDASCAVLVDTSGPALADALSARPMLIKPNADELADLATGHDPVAAARSIARDHQTLVVASLGADGVVAATSERAWRLQPARALTGNPTGAGDALVAGLARGVRAGTELVDMLRDSVALAAAAVRAPFAGEIDRDEYARQRTDVSVQELDVVP